MNIKKNLPMILTFLRFILVIPYIFFLLITNKEAALISLIIYLIASITDWLDGFFARKFDATTSMGAFLDPLADKVLTLSAFFIFSLKKYIFLPVSLVILLLFREYFVTMMRIEIDIIEKNGKNAKNKQTKFVTSKEAKFKTAFQMITIIVFYLFYAINKNYILNLTILSYLNYLPLILFSISLILAYYSSLKYVKNYAEIAFQTITKTVATFFYSGYFPFASGTFASFLALIIFIFFKPNFFVLITSIFILFLLGVYFSSRLERKLMVKDPSIIVIDEVVGMFISLIPITIINQILLLFNYLIKIDSSAIYKVIQNKYFYLLSSFLIFIIFRLYDIIKPFFIKKSQKISGGFGIMIDDILSGFFTIFSFIILTFLVVIILI